MSSEYPDIPSHLQYQQPYPTLRRTPPRTSRSYINPSSPTEKDLPPLPRQHLHRDSTTARSSYAQAASAAPEIASHPHRHRPTSTPQDSNEDYLAERVEQRQSRRSHPSTPSNRRRHFLDSDDDYADGEEEDEGRVGITPSGAQRWDADVDMMYMPPHHEHHRHLDGDIEPAHRSDQELMGFMNKKVFANFLMDPNCIRAFVRFLQVERNVENLHFWHKVNKIKTTLHLLGQVMSDTYDQHVALDAPASVHVDQRDRELIEAHIRKAGELLKSTVWNGPQKRVYERMYRESFPNFIKLQLVFAAQKALASQTPPSHLSGLGDCFCLTDPNFPDNPIILASDGFVEVTVLFIAPLRKTDGTVRYFLGGQVNVTEKLQPSSKLVPLLGDIGSLPAATPDSTPQNVFDSLESYFTSGGSGLSRGLQQQTGAAAGHGRAGNAAHHSVGGVFGTTTTTTRTEMRVGGAVAQIQTDEKKKRRLFGWFGNLFGSKSSTANESNREAVNRAAVVDAMEEVGVERQVVGSQDTLKKLFLVLHPQRGEILFVSWQLLAGLGLLKEKSGGVAPPADSRSRNPTGSTNASSSSASPREETRTTSERPRNKSHGTPDDDDEDTSYYQYMRRTRSRESSSQTTSSVLSQPIYLHPQQDLIGSDFYTRILGPGTLKTARNALERAHFRAAPTSQLIMTNARLTGSPVPMMAHVTPLKDGAGTCGGIVVVLVATDIRSEAILSVVPR
ncbi:hypothetical protein HDV05_004982 [Chytridiales sp. JEL 0842]|nr:hypothetical protein HDV05_004982 [Chytridiales sp. JEL 0842]